MLIPKSDRKKIHEYLFRGIIVDPDLCDPTLINLLQRVSWWPRKTTTYRSTQR